MVICGLSLCDEARGPCRSQPGAAGVGRGDAGGALSGWCESNPGWYEGRSMNWDTVDLQEFVNTLAAYKQRYYGWTNSGEDQYTTMYARLDGVPVVERASYVGDIVLFLNRWHCRVSKTKTPPVLADWIASEYGAIQAITHLSIALPEMIQYRAEFDRLYQSILRLQQAGIHNFGAAAAAKTLHLLHPPLFVMWDNNIRQYTHAMYGYFLADMHAFAVRLQGLLAVTMPGVELEAYLQQVLSYPYRKPLAKYIDEYNWYLAFGQYSKG